MKEKYPDIPIFLLGHSMGGMVALRAVIREKEAAAESGGDDDGGCGRPVAGLALEGPLVIPGMRLPFNMSFRSTPFR